MTTFPPQTGAGSGADDQPGASCGAGEHPGIVFKILPCDDWLSAQASGAYAGSADDLRDGFIHLSTAAQLDGTARRHFAGRPGLVLVAFPASALGDKLVWEPSRGGALFPHLYAPLEASLAIWEAPLPLAADDVPVVPPLPEALTS